MLPFQIWMSHKGKIKTERTKNVKNFLQERTNRSGMRWKMQNLGLQSNVNQMIEGLKNNVNLMIKGQSVKMISWCPQLQPTYKIDDTRSKVEITFKATGEVEVNRCGI